MDADIRAEKYPKVCPNHHLRFDIVEQHQTDRKPNILDMFDVELRQKFGDNPIVEEDEHGCTGANSVAANVDLLGIIWSKMDRPTRVSSVFACKKWATELMK